MTSNHIPEVLRNLALPVIGSPLFIASGPKLVAAQCKAGIVGSFPALNARPAELLDTWLTDLKAELAAYKEANPDAIIGPIAVNQIVHQSNTRLADDVAMCVKHQVPIIISSLRAPPKEMLDAIHSYGGARSEEMMMGTWCLTHMATSSASRVLDWCTIWLTAMGPMIASGLASL